MKQTMRSACWDLPKMITNLILQHQWMAGIAWQAFQTEKLKIIIFPYTTYFLLSLY